MKKRQEGSAMIVVMCVMVVTVALSLALLLTSSVLVNNANRANDKEQCRINAVSVSEALLYEIDNFPEYTKADANGEAQPSAEMPGREDDLRAKLKTVVTTEWFAYNEKAGTLGQLETKGKDYFTYDITMEGMPGTTRLEMYWIDETGEELRKLDMTDPVAASGTFGSVILYLKVTSTVGRESSTIISRYQPLVQLEPSSDADDTEGRQWESWKWKYLGHEWERGAS